MDGPVKILLIEDNPVDAHLVKAFLEQAAPFSLKHATRVSAGLRLLDGGKFDAILLDLMLPDSEGLDTFRRVHARAKHVPIVILSAADEEENALSG